MSENQSNCETMACHCGKSELFKVKKNVWDSAEFVSNRYACIDCLEAALGRRLTKQDLDLNFSWFGADRPIYYQGFKDGLEGYNSPPEKDKNLYEEGQRVGRRFFVDPRDPHNFAG